MSVKTVIVAVDFKSVDSQDNWDGVNYDRYIIKYAGKDLHPTTVIRNGLLLVIRKHGKRGIDCLGRDLSDQYGKNSGKAFNGISKSRILKVGKLSDISSISHVSYGELIKNAIEAGRQFRINNPKLDKQVSAEMPTDRRFPMLSQDRLNGQQILLDDEGYYIEALSKCDNCPHMIRGKHRFTVNENGKVIMNTMTKFIPAEEVTKVPLKHNKYLCMSVGCSVKKVDVGDFDGDSETAKYLRLQRMYPGILGVGSKQVDSGLTSFEVGGMSVDITLKNVPVAIMEQIINLIKGVK